MIRFGRYQLDATQGLLRGAQEIRLTPKSLAVLHVLAGRAGQVVTKDQLFQAVWPDTAVSDSALTSCIQEIRHALQDDVRRPRFIETLPRRGYRFVARTSAHEAADLHVRPEPGRSADLPLVGRDRVVQALLVAYASAARGTRQLCFVSGDAGIGKTRVVQASLAQVEMRSGVRVAWGQCAERYGVGEPYQPLLDALTRLCRQPAGAACVAVLERYAPTWLAQLPGLLAPEQQALVARTVAGTTRERMLRELTNAVEAMAAAVPLVIWLEDLHWSDASTLDWIAAFAQRPEPARVLLIATFRPPLPGDPDRSPASVSDALVAKGLCSELPLSALDRRAVQEYMALRFPPARGAESGFTRLASRLHALTGGNPLFVVNVLADLLARHLLVREDSGWTVAAADEVDLGIPEDIRRTIERRIERLPLQERTLLEIASVAGAVFPVAVIAAAAGRPAGDVDSALAALRRSRLVQDAGVAEWPDGTVGARFAFVHSLYRDVAYDAIPGGHRVELHRRIAERLELAYGDRSPEIAAELAMHFDLGRDSRRAVRFLQHAAANARSRSAFAEARMHFERALRLLADQPADRETAERELSARVGLGAVVMATHGFGAPEAEAAYSRARALCQTLGDTPDRFPAVWGLWLFYWGRGDVTTAHELVGELQALAEAAGDRGIALQALHASWATSFSKGDLEPACAFAAEGMRLYDAARHAAMAATYGSHDAGVCARSFAARALALRGRPEEALATSDEAIALAGSLRHPFSLALALTFRAAVHQSIGDAGAAATRAATAAAIAQEHGFRLMLAWCSTVEGWAAVERGERSGVATIARAIAAMRATGSDQFLPYVLATLADSHLSAGRPRDGLAAVTEALQVVARTNERFYEAELHRLRGELLLALDDDRGGAEEALRESLAIANLQDARLLALRSATCLGRLLRRSSRADEATGLVTQARAHVLGDRTLPDVAAAEALLDSR